MTARNSARNSAPAAVCGGLVAALVTVLALTVRSDTFHSDPATLWWWYAAAWALFAAAAFAVRKVPARQATALVLAGGVAVAATGLLAPPRTSTDAYRYAWDGRVQAAGISPYDHAPADPALTRLRDGWLFPTGPECAGPDRARIPGGPDGDEPHCTRINRPTEHTIYPPVAEGYFLLVHELSPAGARLKPLQVGGALLSVGTTATLLYVLRRRRADPGAGDQAGPHLAAYWAWCPAVPIEAVNNAHADVLGVLLAVAGLSVLGARRRVAGGALLGAATAVKLLPAVVVPGALSGVLAKGRAPVGSRVRTAAAVTLPAAAVIALGYLPYVLGSEASVFGYLSGYVEEEGYRDPSVKNRYALLRLVLPESWAQVAVVAAMLTVVLYVLRRGDPERPWRGALLVTGTAFLLMTPGYPWYALLVVALVALDGRWEWLVVPLAGTAKYVAGRGVPDGDVVGTSGYAIAAAAVLAGWALRDVRRRRADRRTAEPEPAQTSGV
ncbi:glycosyltransferase family 87 protein [Streptomyces sp. KR80]|uniref:glycosyltransferase family 87 protein n=1 Tax=Streptomyces sp. KR80 TaxID=3457426 RepID=UPI003FD1890C